MRVPIGEGLNGPTKTSREMQGLLSRDVQRGGEGSLNVAEVRACRCHEAFDHRVGVRRLEIGDHTLDARGATISPTHTSRSRRSVDAPSVTTISI